MTLISEDSAVADYRVLDGNAAAGLLGQLFAIDLTLAHLECAGCASVQSLATLQLYGLPMGAILRCPRCNACMIRVVAREQDYWLDMQGVRYLRSSAK